MLLALAVPGVTGICEAQEEAGTELPAVVVTASRLEEKAEDVASTTTVIRSSDMRARQQRKVLDALRDVPALDVVQTGPKGSRTSVYIRGSNSEHTLVLIDGVEVNEAISSGRTFDFAQLTDDNIDRIEVVRGPQSVLYGSDAIGGVINIITKKGRGEPRVSMRAEGGSFGTYGTSANVGAGSDRMNFTVGVSRYETDGISSADEALGNTEDDGYENTTFSTRLGVTPTEFFEMNFFARFMDSEAEIDNGSGVRDDPNNTVKRTQWHLKFEPSLRLFDGIWEQKLGVGLTEVNRENNNLQDTAHPNDLTLSNFDSRILDIDWQHNFYIHENNTLTLGAETEEDAGESFFHSESAFGPFTSVFNERKVRTWGFYGQDKITIGENFAGTVGVRVDDHEEFGTRLTYRVTSAYRFVDAGTRIRATLGTGFKSPSLFHLFSSFGDPNLRPEKSLGWDIGIDQELWDRLTVGLT
ncbi:MAG: TonB-dependent receptor, partial [Planctomycetota bacterium]|nr:TonB-dependent receptor [Planctomycetota bacterium]